MNLRCRRSTLRPIRSVMGLIALILCWLAPVQNNAVTVAWDPNTEPMLGGYNLYWGEVGTAPVKYNAGLHTSVAFNSLAPGRSYFFYACAYDLEGWESDPSPMLNYTVPVKLAAPTGLKLVTAPATVAGATAVSLRWNAVAGAATYTIKRATSPAGPWSNVATGVTQTVWSQSVAHPGAIYYYAVSAAHGSSQSTPSTAMGVYLVPPIPAIQAPTLLSASSARLSWQDRSSDEQGFALEFWNGKQWVQIGAVAGATSVDLSGLLSKVTYQFRMRAFKGTLHTGYSTTIKLVMP